MFELLGDIPKGPIWVACSGGMDSVFALDFLRRVPSREVGIAHFNHGTEWASEAEAFVRRLGEHWNLPVQVANIQNLRDPKKSPEEHWRDERYAFLESLPGHVITGHNLDDCVETWLWSACHGEPRTIPHQRNNVLRPFMLVSRQEIRSWVERAHLIWLEDPSNTDTRYMRNRIRHEMVPHALRVNPGLYQVIKRRVKQAQQKTAQNCGISATPLSA